MSTSDPGFVQVARLQGFDSIGTLRDVPVANTSNFNALSAASGIAPFSSLTNQSVIINGSAVDLTVCRLQHGLIVIAGAGVTAGVVALQVSMEAVNWVALGSVTLTAPGVYSFTGVFPARYVRAAITTALTGGTCTAQVGSV